MSNQIGYESDATVGTKSVGLLTLTDEKPLSSTEAASRKAEFDRYTEVDPQRNRPFPTTVPPPLVFSSN
jgi:hypothetical protein